MNIQDMFPFFIISYLRGTAYNKYPSWAYVGSWGSSDFDDFDICYGVH